MRKTIKRKVEVEEPAFDCDICGKGFEWAKEKSPGAGDGRFQYEVNNHKGTIESCFEGLVTLQVDVQEYHIHKACLQKVFKKP